MITIEIENENDVTIKDDNLHVLGGQPSGEYATVEQLNAEKQARQQADQTLQNQKVDKTQLATKTQAGLVYMWEDEYGVHIWNTDPQQVNYTEEENEQGGISYIVTTLNLTEEENEQGGISYIVGEIEGENENE